MRTDRHATEDQISALVDNELHGREQRLVAAHVATCPECGEMAGQALATKRFLAARGQPVAPPETAWPRLIAALDAADGLARAASPTPRLRPVSSVPALTAVGLVLIAVACILRFGLGESGTSGTVFLQAHAAACSGLAWSSALPNVRDVVTARPGGRVWTPVSRSLLRINGEYVDHTLFRVDRTPISEFVLSGRALDRRLMTRVPFGGATFLVRSERSGSVVAWEAAGIAHVLVGRIGTSELLSLAAARRAQAPLAGSL